MWKWKTPFVIGCAFFCVVSSFHAAAGEWCIFAACGIMGIGAGLLAIAARKEESDG